MTEKISTLEIRQGLARRSLPSCR